MLTFIYSSLARLHTDIRFGQNLLKRIFSQNVLFFVRHSTSWDSLSSLILSSLIILSVISVTLFSCFWYSEYIVYLVQFVLFLLSSNISHLLLSSAGGAVYGPFWEAFVSSALWFGFLRWEFFITVSAFLSSVSEGIALHLDTAIRVGFALL